MAIILPGAATRRTAMRFLLGLVTAAALVSSIPSARAQDWCGFLDKEHSKVRCGYSSVTECKQAIGDKKAVCMPDPEFAGVRQGARIRLAASRF
jgi:hypothetical protein